MLPCIRKSLLSTCRSQGLKVAVVLLNKRLASSEMKQGGKGNSTQRWAAVDGCTSVTHVAYGLSETSFIFPITPSSPMSELAEQWSQLGVKNAFGDTVKVDQLQSEGGAAASLHGALTAGSLSTTFTASQGLLLMIPNMYKISGELLPCVMHVAARAIAGQGLSIFGDHQDVMAARQTGFALLCSNTVQETSDLALVSHMATLKARVPFLHFFDGFRVSHTIEKIQLLDYHMMNKLVDHDAIRAHRQRALNPLHPHLRGTNQNPDVYFQLLEASNPFYLKTPAIVEEEMKRLAKVIGRSYELFDYVGPADADMALVMMGSGGPVVEETLSMLWSQGHKIGLVKPRLYRPWSTSHFLNALPKSVKTVCVLDRTKEAGSKGEPLFLDVAASLQNDPSRSHVKLIGGRWGLGQKDFTPASVVAVVDNMKKDNPMEGFTVGIDDDVTHLSLSLGPEPPIIPDSVKQCLIYGFGSDGTVGAVKNAIKIIGDNTEKFVQGYFAYGSQKAGGLTLSHVRFGPEPIKSYYPVKSADYVGCHNPVYIDMYRMADSVKEGGVFCINCNWGSLEEIEKHFPSALKRMLALKKAKLYVVDAFKVADQNGMGRMINVVMQSVFFKLSGVIPYDKAIEYYKAAIKKSYSHRGDAVIAKNYKMVDDALTSLVEIKYPVDSWAALPDTPLAAELRFSDSSNTDFTRNIQGPINKLQGNDIKVSAFSSYPGGIMPHSLSAVEKRGVALEVPEVNMDKCTQCNYCSMACPHAVIRPFLLSQDEVDKAPATYDSRKAKGGSETAGLNYRIQVSPYDCTGCAVCVNTCPDEALRMVPLKDIHKTSGENWDFSMNLPDRSARFDANAVKGSQFHQPLFEFHGACAGCGETPYIKLLTQLFGDRMIIANATGCSSIYGGPYGSNPYTVHKTDKTGPAWGNSLFEDAAEYGFGMAVTVANKRTALKTKVQNLLMEGPDAPVSAELFTQLQEWVDNFTNAGVCRRLAQTLPPLLKKDCSRDHLVKEIYDNVDMIPKIVIWTIGGDGWAYDIDFGGLDHVISSGIDVNILVLDTEVYSNTGGQKSKATPIGAVAKFAAGGREQHKKNMADMAMTYGNVYVANVSMGASMQQTMKAFVEAETFNGPSLVIAYSPCIEHKNIDGMSQTMQHMDIVANSGYFPLFRYDPRLKDLGKNPFQLDTKRLTADVSKVIEGEMRYGILKKKDKQKFDRFISALRNWVIERFANYKRLAAIPGKVDLVKEKNGVPLTILYGSETGTTQELAYRTAAAAKTRGFLPKVMELDEVEIEELSTNPEYRNLMIMCSTCGEGEFPKNARRFHEQLVKHATTTNASNSLDLSKVNFSVFALGDSSYHKFCIAGTEIDRLLGQLGAKRLIPCGIGNDRDEDKYETGYDKWLPSWWEGQNAPEPVDDGKLPSSNFDFSILDIKKESSKTPYKAIAPSSAVQVNVMLNQPLCPPDYDRDIRHLKLTLPEGTELPYLLGDVLNIFPCNDPVQVIDFLSWYKFDNKSILKPDTLIRLKVKPGAQVDGRKINATLRARRVDQLFVELLDLFGRPSKSFYQFLAKFATDQKQKTELQMIGEGKTAEGKTKYSSLVAETVTYADILKIYDSARPSLDQLLTSIPCIKPRLYSIASSPRLVGPGKIELAIVVLNWKTPSGKKRTGLGTDFIQRLQAGDSIQASITSGTFNFPASPETPMIMAGLGTGLAPFRAFAQERKWMKNKGIKTGPMWLFYGCRHKSKDYILGNELEDLHAEGVITQLHPAFSRDQEKKVYVQDKINAKSKELYEDLIKKRGYFYLCGQAGQVETDIKNAVYDSISAAEGITREESKKKFEVLAEEGRYCPELY